MSVEFLDSLTRDPFLVLMAFFILVGMRRSDWNDPFLVLCCVYFVVGMRSLSLQWSISGFGIRSYWKWACVAPVLTLKRILVGFYRLLCELKFGCEVWCTSRLASSLFALCLGGALHKSRRREVHHFCEDFYFHVFLRARVCVLH